MAKVGKRARRLTKLRIDEISAVDSGAGRGVEVVLLKRDKKPPKFIFNDTFGLVRNPARKSAEVEKNLPTSGGLVDDDRAAASLAAAKREIAENREFAKSAGASLPGTEDHTTDIEKAAEMIAVAKVAGAIAKIMARSEKPISRDQAMYRMATSPEFTEEWLLAKSMAAVVPAPVSEPAPIAKSDAMLALEKKARKIMKRDPRLSAASAFALAYERNPHLAQADKAHFFAKGAAA
jgi:hypothetical protein